MHTEVARIKSFLNVWTDITTTVKIQGPKRQKE